MALFDYREVDDTLIAMNRKTFLTTLGTILVAPFLSKSTASAERISIVGATKEDYDALGITPRIGYLSVDDCPTGTTHDEWKIFLDGVEVDRLHSVHDREGWVEQYVMDEEWPGVIKKEWRFPEKRKDNERIPVMQRVYGDYQVIYTGNDPRYAAFKPV